MRDEPRVEEGLKRVMGPVSSTCVVVGAIVGVGIFFTPTRVAELAGSGHLALAAWAGGGLIALLGALTFAELGGLYSSSGSQYRILREAYGPLPAFLFVFCNATAVQAGAIAIIALICAQNLGMATTGHVPGSGVQLVLSTLLIVGLTGANILGVKWGGAIQNITVYAKVAALLMITALAVFLGDPPEPEPVLTSDSSSGSAVALFFAALVPTLFSFGGWQHALWIGGEVRNPGKNVPRAIIGGVIIVVVVYLLANWAYLELLGYDRVRESRTLAADAVATVWPAWGGRAVAFAVAFSALGVLNAQLLSGPRLIYAMARDGRFFKVFARVHPSFSTPLHAIALMGSIALTLLLIVGENGVGQLITGVVFIDCIFFILTGGALFVLRRRKPDVPRPIKVPFYPIVPALFVLGEIGVVIGAYGDPETRGAAKVGAIWILLASLVYFFFFRGSKGADSDE